MVDHGGGTGGGSMRGGVCSETGAGRKTPVVSGSELPLSGGVMEVPLGRGVPCPGWARRVVSDRRSTVVDATTMAVSAVTMVRSGGRGFLRVRARRLLKSSESMRGMLSC